MAKITGTKNFETINVTSGTNTVDGLGGSDIIKDYKGGNTSYIFNRTYGQPTIQDNAGTDAVYFGDDITVDDLRFYKSSANNLFIQLKDTFDKLEIKQWFVDSKYKIEKFVFSDGTVLTSADVDKLVQTNVRVIVGSSSGGTIKVGQGSNLIYTLTGGHDVYVTGGTNIIYPSTGVNYISLKGSGTTELYLSPGTDTVDDNASGATKYIFEKNWGTSTAVINNAKGSNDSLVFGIGIDKKQLSFTKSGNNLIIGVIGTSCSITLNNWISKSASQISTIQFFDGTTMTAADVNNILNKNTGGDLTPTIVGTTGDDAFAGNNTNDVYWTKTGKDRIVDYYGDDTYLFYKGDGQKTLIDTYGSDKIVFGSGIDVEDLTFTKSGTNLIIKRLNSSDAITVCNFYKSSAYTMESLVFNDGTKITSAQITNLIDNGKSSFDNQGGGSSEDPSDPVDPGNETPDTNLTPTILGTTGDDTFSGNSTDDVYWTKTGKDRIVDWDGNDTYIYNKGEGSKTIIDTYGTDKIAFGSDIKTSDLTFIKDNNNLMINVTSSSNRITLCNWFKSSTYVVESLEFADGSKISSSDVNNIIQSMSSYTTNSSSAIASISADSTIKTTELVPVSS